MEPASQMRPVRRFSWCASSHSMAIKRDGSLWAWGRNDSGQLGGNLPTHHENGRPMFQQTPMKIMEDVIAVSAGIEQTMAIKSDGSLWAWGRNVFGVISSACAAIPQSPVKVMDNVVSVSAGFAWAMVIDANGNLWRLEYDRDQYSYCVLSETLADIEGTDYIWSCVANCDETHRFAPIKIMDDIFAVSTWGDRFWSSHTMVIKTDGSLWTWGTENEYGQLGHYIGVGIFESDMSWEETLEIWSILDEPRQIIDSVMLSTSDVLFSASRRKDKGTASSS